MDSKKSNKKNFFKKNAYYFIIASVMLVFVAVAVILFANQQANSTLQSSSDNTLEKPQTSIVDPNAGDSSTVNGGGTEEDSSGDDGGNSTNPNKPTQTVISFILPIQNASVICDYTSASVIYNKTLNVYTGHLAIDFGAEYGSEVVAVYGGVIESVTTSYLTGTSVTVDHGNGLKTVYNSIESVEGLTEGMAINQGQVIGYVSDNNRQEYKDGPHLHFEVWENGEKVSPYKYLTVSEK